jgi:hypothetical protein
MQFINEREKETAAIKRVQGYSETVADWKSTPFNLAIFTLTVVSIA